MELFVDFDDTVFNTRKGFLPALRDVFVRSGVPSDIFDRTYEQCTAHRVADGLSYTPHAHADFLRAEGYALLGLERAYEQLLTVASRWVYRDFIDFVRASDVPVVMVTYGDDTFQREKIRASGVGALVRDVIVTQGEKARAIDAYAPHASSPLVIVDDKVSVFARVKALRRPTYTVHAVRRGGPCAHTLCDAHIASFDQLRDVLAAASSVGNAR